MPVTYNGVQFCLHFRQLTESVLDDFGWELLQDFALEPPEDERLDLE
jgi:hypothetical protein